jgi:hypothetical protein
VGNQVFFINNTNFSKAMDEHQTSTIDTTYSNQPYKEIEYKKGNLAAQSDASFTFQIKHKHFSQFTIHFTSHNLPYDTLSMHTKKLIENARTIVIEPIQWEEESQDLRSHINTVFKSHLLDPEAHRKMKSEMSEQDYAKLVAPFRKECSLLFMTENEIPEKLKREHAPAIIKKKNGSYHLIVYTSDDIKLIPNPDGVEFKELNDFFRNHHQQKKILLMRDNPIIQHITLKGGHTLSKFIDFFPEIEFEHISPLAFCFLLRSAYKEKRDSNGMDRQIEKISIDGRKILAGLESCFENFITLMPQRIQLWRQAQEKFLAEQCSTFDAWHLDTQDICWYLNELDKENVHTDNPWDDHYKNGNFFQISYLSDQANIQDIDSVMERNHKWIPKIKKFIMLPDCYPLPLIINVGFGHHGLLGLLENEQFEIMILNKSGETYPFHYTQDYEVFKRTCGEFF